MAIPRETALGIFSTTMLKSYTELIPSPNFLSSFYTVKTSSAKQIGVEIERGNEMIAVQSLRGTNGNLNTSSLWAGKYFLPPFYNEFGNATALDRYDRTPFVGTDFTPETIGLFGTDVAKMQLKNRAKIERAKELMCAGVFQTGVVDIKNGDNIDYGRKATSMVDLGAAGYWGNTDAAIEAQLIAGAEFIRREGKNGTPEFNLVLSGAAYTALKGSDYFAKYANFQNVQLIDVKQPQAKAFSAAYHGRITAGAYLFNIWSYDEIYQDSDEVYHRYLDQDTAFMTPVSGTRFELSHAGVPAIMRDKSKAEFGKYIAQVAGEYWMYDRVDEANFAHEFGVMSAPLAIPVTVDMIYTMTVLGTGNPEIG